MATESIFIRPNTLLVPETVKLSPIDQFTIRVYTPALLLFRLSANASRAVVSSELQRGLASLLDDIPILAGNVITEDETRGTVQLDIPENAGVLFKVKEMVDAEKGPVLDFAELEKACFPSSSLDPSLLSPIHLVPEPVAPCLAVQANFIRGGLILATYVHHSVADGAALGTFWKAWSRHTAAVSEARLIPTSESFAFEALERSPLFQGTRSRRKLTDFPGFKETRRPITADSGTSPLYVAPGSKASTEAKTATKLPPKLAIAYWYISRDKLRKLEEMAKPKDPKESRRTESEVLSAFIWQHYSGARCLLERGVETVAFFMPCNGRARLDPPLHPDYLGNAVVHSRAELPIAELFSSEPDALYRIASVIGASVDWWSSDTIWDLLGAMEAWPRVGDVERSMDITCQTDLEITNTSPFPLYDTYWGANLGNPQIFRMPAIFVLDGQVNILPRWLDGGLEFITYLDVETLDRLRADKEFAEFAQFRCV